MGSHHRLKGPCFHPNCPQTERCSEYVAIEENETTNCDINESPLGDSGSRRDRIGEPAGHSRCQCNRFSANGTHDEGGRVFTQLDEYSDQLMGYM